jgi:methylthioribose-1-phosphate isomerase
MNQRPNPIEWIGDARSGFLRLIDQTQLPDEVAHLDCRDVESVWGAIRRLSVRGAPAIGIAAAYGCVIGAQQGRFSEAAEYLATSRPTAVNLFWAIDRMRRLNRNDPESLLAEAKEIHEEDRRMCEAIGRHAMELIPEQGGVLTHCNAGALATGGIGTATAPMYLAHESGRSFHVFADETRPLLQGARLTAWELGAAGIDVTLICDDMAATVMRDGQVQMVITGADRIAANGDVANKIGTYGLAVMARHHDIPFYVAAPSSTFDLSIGSGEEIPIEQRDADEVKCGFGKATAPEQVKVFNPAFDVTPHELITAIITERGRIEPVNRERVAKMLGESS